MAEEDDKAKQPPVLGTNKTNETDWVFYLQQLLNFAFEQQVVLENGRWDDRTSNAVVHYRRHYNLGSDDIVDKETWKKLGWTEPASAAKATEVKTVHKDVQLVPAPNQDLSWAAAVATVLGSVGEPWSVDKVCETAGVGQVRVGFSELPQHADNLRLKAVTVAITEPTSWTAALEAHGAILSKTDNDTHIVVVTGIRKNPADAAKVDLFIMDPGYNTQEWRDFHEQFVKGYNLAAANAELYAGT